MKATLVIQDNLNQVVLTPENDYEKNVLNLINSNKVETALKVGNFAECQGGWIRYYPFYNGYDVDGENIDSLMIVLKQKS